ncbi:MAG TPA: SurA N-terminal domain-containing protein [Candidatus Saccharimonadales bacterium]|nr:SurA N-terminal domain-containing protein [Candidatus Saccharimonadales bacterium]
MKKLKKTKKLKLTKPDVNALKAKLPIGQGKTADEKMSEALSDVPRITNETVSEHREEVLAGARKYIYPLQHSKHRIVRVSIALFAVVIIVFFVSIGLSLYKFQSTSGFTYNVTRIIPFPVAKAGKSWVSYESYLFELRRNLHYYKTQQPQAVLTGKQGKALIQHLKEQAMTQAIEDAYVKQLASRYHVSVSSTAVNNEVELVRSQNRLGDSDRVFREVLNEFWGWNEGDFKRQLKQEMLRQAVVAKLDTATNDRANLALKQLVGGANFAAVAKYQSDDVATKNNAGKYGSPITVDDSNLSPILSQEIFKLNPGETSGIINTGYTLDIVKVLTASGSRRTAAHIQFTFKDINTYIKPLQDKTPAHQYIKV